MADDQRYARARTVSLDFDGVLATLVLGRAWEKTRAKKKKGVPLVSPLVRRLKSFIASLTEGTRRPLPQSEDVLRRLRSPQRKLLILTSRTGEGIPAAERWLLKYRWNDFFDRVIFNTAGEDADEFKAKMVRTEAIDVHIDDDAETLAHLARQFPEKRFIHLNYYGRKSPAAANIVVVRSWDEIPGVLSQKEKARPA
jgi:hypothetical protein